MPTKTNKKTPDHHKTLPSPLSFFSLTIFIISKQSQMYRRWFAFWKGPEGLLPLWASLALHVSNDRSKFNTVTRKVTNDLFRQNDNFFQCTRTTLLSDPVRLTRWSRKTWHRFKVKPTCSLSAWNDVNVFSKQHIQFYFQLLRWTEKLRLTALFIFNRRTKKGWWIEWDNFVFGPCCGRL